MSLDDCYHSLQCCQDDSWDYIRQSFEKRIHTRRNHHFFERYYYAYIKIAQNHELVEGTVQDLTKKDKSFYTFVLLQIVLKIFLVHFQCLSIYQQLF